MDWHIDVKRRTEETQAREAAAKQEAIDQWISWYQLTHLLTKHQDTEVDPMRMTWDGGGPAGLFAILARANDHEVTVDEQAQPADGFGLGVDFWDGLLRELDVYDPETRRLVRQYAIPSFGYSVRYRRQLELLRSKAIEVGVHIEVGRITDIDVVARSTDLVIASAGVNSTLRRQQADFIPRVTRLRNCPICLDSGGRVDSLWPAPGPTTADAAVAA